ncbi:hypothetical protein D9758_010227 [Tetrapyrgos nigripes]|uniref:Carboxylic ester hydrolase n=1 Tax=Tetrapyrgos nigripes TaxID=182062 RepID=A0A8H5CXD8_9AGAR|nr:hypothetical protein D9758_010227 [Tetrapyrgos nigripes]
MNNAVPFLSRPCLNDVLKIAYRGRHIKSRGLLSPPCSFMASMSHSFPSIFLRVACLLLFCPSILSAVLDVQTSSGTFRGVSAKGTEKWLGIPYAQAPVGRLRFKAPVPITNPSNALKVASTFGNACPQPSADLGAPISEDCLFLNIWRPQNTTADAGLPVLVWIHGGAYTTGASSSPSSDPTRFITRSVSIDKPIVFVSINYRLNTFGFLSSSLVAPEDLNAGLLDQRQALTFVQDNIASFGGDPSKVTIWGQSAGAGSVESHFLYPSSRPLFRAGIGESSTGPFKSSPPASTYDKPNKPFSRLLAATGCTFGPNALSCLQNVSLQTLMGISNGMIGNTLNGQLWQPSIGPEGSFATAQASEVVQSGDFLHLPYMGGTNVNEGAGFSISVAGLNLTGAAQDARFVQYISELFIDNSTITQDVYNEILANWRANDRTLGAPFNTGDSLFDRAEAWYTDEMFLSPRRLFFEHGSSLQTMFAYYFREFIPGNNPMLGVAHASELVLLFGPVPTSVENQFANQMLDAWLNFVNDLNPGLNGWPAYTPEDRQVMQLLRDNITVISDGEDAQLPMSVGSLVITFMIDWDTDKTDFLNSRRVLEEFQK